MVNAIVEGVSDEGIGDASEMASDSGLSAEPCVRSESGVAALGAYGEDDDAATQLVEPLHSEPRWLVQITPLDRRSMETALLVTEMLEGRLSPSTPVWRDGMRDWTPIERALDLPVRRSGVRPAAGGAAREDGMASDPSAPRRGSATQGAAAWAAASRSPTLAGPAFWLVNAAVALAVAAATLGVLTAGGVFE